MKLIKNLVLFEIIFRLRYGNPWEIPRPEYQIPVNLYGRVIEQNGKPKWVDTKVKNTDKLKLYFIQFISRLLWLCLMIHQFQVLITMFVTILRKKHLNFR
jgi:hypothetical protein